MVLQKGTMHFLVKEAGDEIPNEMCMVLSRSCWEACTSSSVRLVARCDASYSSPAGSPQFLTRGAVVWFIVRCLAFR